MKNYLQLLFISFVLSTFTASAQKPESTTADHFTALDNNTRNTNLSNKLPDYADTYIHESYGKVLNPSTNNPLVLLTSSTQKYWLDYEHYDKFQILETGGGIAKTYQASIRSQLSSNQVGDIGGMATTSQEHLASEPLGFVRPTSTRQISANQLIRYVGDYESTNLSARIELRNGNSLYLIVPGQTDYELEFIDNHVFFNKEQPNYFAHFALNQQGNVATLSIIQSNGDFTLTRITTSRSLQPKAEHKKSITYVTPKYLLKPLRCKLIQMCTKEPMESNVSLS
ncbi:hypothetical protein GCM10028807_14470 [Spirosoma daeguense]